MATNEILKGCGLSTGAVLAPNRKRRRVLKWVKIQTSITGFFPDPVISDHPPIVEFLRAGRYNPMG
jgi:hypothetical protein